MVFAVLQDGMGSMESLAKAKGHRPRSYTTAYSLHED